MDQKNDFTVFASLAIFLMQFRPESQSLAYTLTNSLAHSLTHSPTHSLAHTLTLPHTHSPTHSLAPTLTGSFMLQRIEDCMFPDSETLEFFAK